MQFRKNLSLKDMKTISDTIVERSLNGKRVLKMGSFYKNVGARLKAKDFVLVRSNYRNPIRDGFKIYTCVAFHDEYTVSTNKTLYSPVWQYFNEANANYDNLTFQIDIDKVLHDFKNVDWSGCDSMKIANAFLNIICYLTDGDAQKMISYLSDYSNVKTWTVRSDTWASLSYGKTHELILVTEPSTTTDKQRADFVGLSFSYQRQNTEI